jgi:hypothetical protein
MPHATASEARPGGERTGRRSFRPGFRPDPACVVGTRSWLDLGTAGLPDDEPAGYPDDLVAQVLADQGREESLGGW